MKIGVRGLFCEPRIPNPACIVAVFVNAVLSERDRSGGYCGRSEVAHLARGDLHRLRAGCEQQRKVGSK